MFSADGGTTWTEAREDLMPPIYTFMRDLDFAPDGRKGIIVGQGGRILTTADSGHEWKQVLPVENPTEAS